jgi:hypothetical protein
LPDMRVMPVIEKDCSEIVETLLRQGRSMVWQDMCNTNDCLSKYKCM